jgi:hypothetical protein
VRNNQNEFDGSSGEQPVDILLVLHGGHEDKIVVGGKAGDEFPGEGAVVEIPNSYIYTLDIPREDIREGY